MTYPPISWSGKYDLQHWFKRYIDLDNCPIRQIQKRYEISDSSNIGEKSFFLSFFNNNNEEIIQYFNKKSLVFIHKICEVYYLFEYY